MSSFPPEFLRVQEEILASAEGALPKMFQEELGRSYEYLIDLPHEPDDRLKRMMEDMLHTCHLPQPPVAVAPSDPVEEQPGKLKGTVASPENRMAKSPQGEVNETNSLSDMWRMLEAQSTSNGFPVSPMGYNVFDDQRMSWLKREAGSWNEQEASRRKCEEWLKKL